MIILNQRDIRWKDKKINNTTSTIGNYGCTITCLAMLADTTPDVVNTKLMSVGGFLKDLVIWASINKTDLPIRFPDMGRAYIYNNDKVKEAIDINGGCLVEVDFDGVTTTPNDRHWVLFVGNGKAYDPWTGTEILTTKYKILKGYCIINKIKMENTNIYKGLDLTNKESMKVAVDVWSDLMAGKYKSASEFEMLNKQVVEKNEQIITLTNKVHDLQLQMAEIERQIAKIEANFIEKEKEVIKWQKLNTTANTTISEQILKIDELDRLAKDNRNLYLQKNDEFNAYKLVEKETIKTEIINEASIGDLFTLLVNKILKK